MGKGVYLAWAVLFPFIHSGVASEIDITWLKLSPKFAFSTSALESNACTKETVCYEVYLSVQTEDGVLKRAFLSEGSEFSLFGRIELTAEEIKGLQFYRDRFKRYWLKSLVIDKRLLAYILRGHSALLCGPPKPLDNLPADLSLSMEFPTDGLGEEILVSRTACRTFPAKYKDGTAVNIQVNFSERQWPNFQ